jgi:hypothetical protein
MAIAIKSIPVLKNRAANTFTRKAASNSAKKHSVSFTKQSKTAYKILAKAKI